MDFALDSLEAYAANYIREEIQQEAIVRHLDSFSRFVEVAALMNEQVAKVGGLARDAVVARPTVQGYFTVLVDTLIGTWLPAWRKRAKVKEVVTPKFYLSDPGVVRALAGRLRDPWTPQSGGACSRRGFCTSSAPRWLRRALEVNFTIGARPAAVRWISCGPEVRTPWAWK